ncbi:unnamed protein product [Periconia digitata]|uniref:ubiquitinyl hydrolase 1 n=1 Tax=Periconia digitata TaxID=1303443 RepID=A0A9W4XVM9_9PLEO|nr:unnamed protein product [Periconia digitata]
MAATGGLDTVLQELYFHVALPRNVPGREAHNLFEVDAALLDRLVEAAKLLTTRVPVQHHTAVDAVRLSLVCSKSMNVEGKIDKTLFTKELGGMSPNQALVLYVTEQNAALLLYKKTNSDLTVEAFEASAANESVCAAESALQWDFPGQAVCLPRGVYMDASFQDSFARFLEQSSIESVKQFSAVTFKAAAPLPEVRDTTDPSLVTGLLMTILRSVGHNHAVHTLRKRVRDTVSFREARKPWRRSPFYLVLRVTIQRHLIHLLGAMTGRLYYKIIMCIFISQLMEATLDIIPHEDTHFLMQKLGRRLAKLEDEYQGTSASHDLHSSLLQGLRPQFEKSLSNVNNRLTQHWKLFQAKTQRVIKEIPYFAKEHELKVQLSSSGPHLWRILSSTGTAHHTPLHSSLDLLRQHAASVEKAQPLRKIANRCIDIARFERDEVLSVDHALPSTDPADDCRNLASTINSYMLKVGPVFDGYSNLKSQFILNVIELWVDMDQQAVRCFPLLGRYHPGIDPILLDDLELLSLDEMIRVQNAQAYLSRRCLPLAGGPVKTIFDPPAEDTFAVAYFDMSPELQQLRQRIDVDSAILRLRKEDEWRALKAEHERLMQLIAESTCAYHTIVTPEGALIQEHVKGCIKHKYKWQAKQIKIRIFENPLPAFEPAAKTVVFELRCPKTLASYRDATWSIISTFAFGRSNPLENIPILRNYPSLQQYATASKSAVTLGSSTKSHLDCHYKESTFPVALHHVCRPCGLTYDYYDVVSKTWTQREGAGSLSRHFVLNLPRQSPYRSLQLTNGSWPSSNAILASQTKCPPDLNVHEFMAWQSLLSGTHSRWLCLLREMGATNLNFSSESSWAIIVKLILQVGPSSTGDLLRDAHHVFNDRAFCSNLVDQVEYRLGTLRRNWREQLQMDILISILLKACSLCPDRRSRYKARELLDTCREITWEWCVMLQSLEHHGSNDTTLFAAWAAILCKRTFQGLEDLASELSSMALKYFVGASVLLQENLTGDIEHTPHSLCSQVLNDTLFTYEHREIIQTAILANQGAFLSAMNDIWPVLPEYLARQPLVEPLSEGYWIQVSMRSNESNNAHFIHYNIQHGDLLINGKQAGTLPAQYRANPYIEKLFGTHNLRVLPSSQLGMSLYIKRRMPKGYNVHLGLREGIHVIRATREGSTFELIASHHFYGANASDLPAPLIENCWHWLDIYTGIMEIRQDNPWKSKDGNWKVDVRTRTVYRRGSVLVDPKSDLAALIAQNFWFFEYPKNIVVYQPAQKPDKPRPHLAIELKRLELNFHVNNRRLLECRQLKAEIAPSYLQDAGVWYGLKSKIVLQTVGNERQRSLLVPTGPMKYAKFNQHVITTVDNDGSYMRYEINEVLGRLECPAEPRLLYFKALWHAYTSYFLPDPLTGRTGKEEALSFLQSGLCMPWTYLSSVSTQYLIDIAQMTPKRTYYPSTLKSMESVSWNPRLTTTIQDDRYRAAVEKICHRSEDLRLFDTGVDEPAPTQCPEGNVQLEGRAVRRSDLRSTPGSATFYRSRDGFDTSQERINVAEISRLLAGWSSKIPCTPDLASALQKYPIIGGNIGEFQRVQLFDFITTDMGENWGSLVNSALQAGPDDRYRLIFLFAAIAYSTDADMSLLRPLVSYSLIPELKDIPHPKHASYVRFNPGEVLAIKDMTESMKPARMPYNPIPQTQDNKGQVGQLALRRIQHEENTLKACGELASSIRKFWPHTELNSENLPAVDEKLIDAEKALELIQPEFTRLSHNHVFEEYLSRVQIIMLEHDVKRSSDGSECVDQPTQPPPKLLPHHPTPSCSTRQTTLRNLLLNPEVRILWTTPNLNEFTNLFADTTNSSKGNKHQPWTKSSVQTDDTLHFKPMAEGKMAGEDSSTKTLRHIVQGLRRSDSPMQEQYASELEQSIDSLVRLNEKPSLKPPPFKPTELRRKIKSAEQDCHQMYYNICQAVESGDQRAAWLKYAGLWPRVTRLSLLAELSSKITSDLGKDVKEALVAFGIKIAVLQRLLRIEDASGKNKKQQLDDELANSGHTNWLPLNRPDWLLLEIDNNFMLRAEQVEVAEATIMPSSRQNSVVQLLMGKGKTSCILPMVAAVLADKSNLLRIVVPRPLLLQSAQVMQIKLGSLLDREIMHIPFSRKTPTNDIMLGKYFHMQSELRKNGGVLMTLPEHILSYKLSGMQRLCDARLDEGTKMIKFQGWLDRHARDVLDECDVSLAIRTQLIYPSGSQTTVDGHPLRWQCIQAVLRLIHLYLPVLERQFPHSIEVVEKAEGDFPLIYLLREDVQVYLVDSLVQDICNGQLSSLPCAEIPLSGQEHIRNFISCPMVSPQTYRRVKSLFRDKLHLMKVLYHLRGLFVHRILLSSLKKRWNVQYGLHPDRDPIAVPYHAKGVPSMTSEWGHPDVAIILTCLSFYYQGLSLPQFKQSFEQLTKTDEPSIEFEKWITQDLPENLRDFNSINVEDYSQLVELHRHVRLNMYLLDFYLNNFVFPKHAKQFAMKLQASGWDLILGDPTSSSRCQTTGFSGTNDSRHQLPMTISQNNELEDLSHTNAEVLSYLLAERNRDYILAVNGRERFSETDLLRKLREVGIRILIDAGAQILEHSNADLAAAWLKVDTEAAAAVYFDSFHRPLVRYRKGKSLPLVATTFAENLENCVVYLDESHCRGTDLKLPICARAALTLGPHVTKDGVAQAAMRLRLLGTSQSVTFFAPPEVHQGILDMRDPDQQDPVHSENDVHSEDVIAWLLQQSCHAIEQLEPLYCMQGNTYLQHAQAKINNPRFLDWEHQRARYLGIIQSKEVQTLQQLYEPKRLHRVNGDEFTTLRPALRKFAKDLEGRKQNFQDKGSAVHSSALEEVEQEREVEHEVENVREVQIPTHYAALKIPGLHKDIRDFVRSGIANPSSEAYHPIFWALQNTAMGKRYGASLKVPSTASMLMISTQYRRTVRLVEPNDNFMRPCQWLLLSSRTGQAVALSPEEADAVLPLLRNTRGPAHLIVYSAPVTRRMLHFNDLNYYAVPSLPKYFTIPTLLRIELGIFAGRLYFAWTEYEAMCDYLGIARTVEETYDQDSCFTTKPLSFLHEWLAVLRKGQDFEHTPMGFLTTGKPLLKEHPFFMNRDRDKVEASIPLVATDGIADQHDDDSDDDDHDDDEMFEQNNLPRKSGIVHDKPITFNEEGNEFFGALEEQVNGAGVKESSDGSRASDDSD